MGQEKAVLTLANTPSRDDLADDRRVVFPGSPRGFQYGAAVKFPVPRHEEEVGQQGPYNQGSSRWPSPKN